MIVKHFATAVRPEPGYGFGVDYVRQEYTTSEGFQLTHFISVFTTDMGTQKLRMRFDDQSNVATVILDEDDDCDFPAMLDYVGSVEDLIAKAFGPPEDGKIGDHVLDEVEKKQMVKGAMLLVNLVNGVLFTFIQAIADMGWDD
jgi:hypothetical protein